MLQHLYIHVPFCASKCDYCAFYSVPVQPQLADAYAGLPARELAVLLRQMPELATGAPQTLYIGGGTPATLGGANFARMLAALDAVVDLSSLQEWTLELNPASASKDFLQLLQRLGVTRLSFGVQIFDDAALRRIGRRHSAATARAAIALAQDLGFRNIGVDLIAGLPGVDAALWQASLDILSGLKLQHASVYTLIVEPRTPLAQRVAAGLALADDATQLDQLQTAVTQLEQCGLRRYEVSNFALDGFKCQHNLAVWRGADYLGLGPGAASRVGCRRWQNSAQLANYDAQLAHDALPPREAELLDAHDDVIERLLFSLRLAEGLYLDATNPLLRGNGAEAIICRWRSVLQRLQGHGIVQCTGQRWQLTARGFEVCDAVLAELL